MNMFTYGTTIQNSPTLWQHFAPISQFQIDLQDEATFPQFAYIEPASSAGLDEHPSDADFSPVNVQLGAQYVQDKIMNYYLASPTYNDSALIFTYDEAGGLYDHVSPQPVPPPYAAGNPLNNPIDLVAGTNGSNGDICTNPGQVIGQGTCTFGWTGYRIPLVVISPYAKKNFVSHIVRDTTAVLAMVEARFGLTALTDRDAYYLPTNANDYSMDEFFDFTSPAWTTPPTNLLPQSTSQPCDQTPAASWNEPPLVTAKVIGGGSVSSNPPFVVNNNVCVMNSWCTVPATAASIVTLTATPNTGSNFMGWSGGGCTGTTPTCSVTAAGQQFVTATFNP
jgi:phospholipase C